MPDGGHATHDLRRFVEAQRETYAGDPGPDGECIRLAYSWTSEEDLREGARRLAEACARVAGSH